MREINAREFDLNPDRIRQWVNQYGFPEDTRLEMNGDASPELKSLISSCNSQHPSRQETPIEAIPRSPSPAFSVPAQSPQGSKSPISVSEAGTPSGEPSAPESIVSEKPDEVEINQGQNQETLDPRYTAVLHSLAEIKQSQQSFVDKLERLESRFEGFKQNNELTEIVNDAPKELKKTFSKQVNELRIQLENKIKSLSNKIVDVENQKPHVQELQVDWDSSDNREAFKNRFRQELLSMDNKNQIKDWAKTEQASFQVSLSR